MPKIRANFEIDRKLWREFQIYVRVNGTSASKLLRNTIRQILGKPSSEMEKDRK